MSILDDTIATMTDTDTVLDSALIYIQSVPAMTQAAIDKALAGGATAAQLAPLVALQAEQQTKSQAVKAALVAGTSEAPPAA
jgi:hypothetical protein